jgi:hypothetical protein
MDNTDNDGKDGKMTALEVAIYKISPHARLKMSQIFSDKKCFAGSQKSNFSFFYS